MVFFNKKNFLVLSLFIMFGCDNNVNFAVPVSSEEFRQSLAYNNKVDLLFVIDDSDSMKKVQEKLLNSITPLTASLNQLKLDYRIASTSTTMASWLPTAGRLVGEPKFITLSTPDFQTRLTERMIFETQGSSLEKGLEAVKSVLSPDYQNGEGQNFLRSDALLVIVYISNENDKSSNVVTAGTDKTKYYSDFLDQLKPTWSNGQRSWIFNFIGFITAGDPCVGGDFTGYKEIGVNQMEMAQKSNGRIESICQASFASAISNIRARLVEYLTDYKLSKAPDVESIRVYVNKQLIPMDATTGWSYVAELNAVRFHGASVPKADDDIRIEFLPSGGN